MLPCELHESGRRTVVGRFCALATTCQMRESGSDGGHSSFICRSIGMRTAGNDIRDFENGNPVTAALPATMSVVAGRENPHSVR